MATNETLWKEIPINEGLCLWAASRVCDGVMQGYVIFPASCEIVQGECATEPSYWPRIMCGTGRRVEELLVGVPGKWRGTSEWIFDEVFGTPRLGRGTSPKHYSSDDEELFFAKVTGGSCPYVHFIWADFPGGTLEAAREAASILAERFVEHMRQYPSICWPFVLFRRSLRDNGFKQDNRRGEVPLVESESWYRTSNPVRYSRDRRRIIEVVVLHADGRVEWKEVEK